MRVKLEELYIHNVNLHIKLTETARYKTAVIFTKNINYPAKKTPYYDFLMEQIQSSHGAFGLKSEKDVLIVIERFRKLFKDVMVNGVKNKINVYIGDDGEICTIEGSHRAAILLVTGYSYTDAIIGTEGKIPVPVRDREKERGWTDSWGNFVDNVEKSSINKFIYQPINHPFFEGKYSWRKCADRLNMLLKVLDENDVVLDIGTHFGFFVRELTKRDYTAIGIDNNKRHIEIANKIDKIEGISCNFIFGDAISYLKNTDEEYDAVLLLSALHHIPDDNAKIEILKMVSNKSKKTIIEAITPDSYPYSKGKSYLLDSSNITDAILDNTKYKSWDVIGISDVKRPLLIFT